MEAADLLFELRTEELPPRTLPALSAALTDGIVKGIDAAGIPHGMVHAYATPRRLAVRIEKLAAHQPDREVERRGPPVANSFDAAGAPTQAALAFAKSCGVGVEALSRLTTEKGAWLQFRGTERGAATADLVRDIINQSIALLPIAKRMRWGASSVEFVRPVHGVVLMHGEQVLPAEILGLKSDRITAGHRFHAPKPIALKDAKSYAGALKRARVIADFGARRELIRSAVTQAAAASGTQAGIAGAVPLIEAALLDEVTALVEWPVAIAGNFEARFLELPREVVIATIQDHQRYFAVQAPDGTLTGGFVTVANLESRDPAQVRAGNERVVRPRLSDAAFFWEQDRRSSLGALAAKLKDVTFQTKLGSYAEKTARVRSLAVAIGRQIGADAGVAQAAELAKADLMSAMVGEFPELQGIMGRYYAAAEGVPAEVAAAIEEHYRPRFAGDVIPATRTGQALALADKLDTLVGIFAIEQRPTGAKDPFGLRRAALGVLRILLDAHLDLDLADLLAAAAAAQPVQRSGVAQEVYEFIAERLRGILLETEGTGSEMVDAVLAMRPRSPLDALTRLAALKEFLRLPDAPVLAAINKRIANILKKTRIAADATVDVSQLSEDAERALHRALDELKSPVLEASRQRRYAESLQALVGLRAPVNEFFERVMVMDENPARRANRLALLRDVQLLLGGVADLSRLPG
jgi:glycyl-tRNA synthetase beta chain